MPALPGPPLDPSTLLFSTAVMGFVMAAFAFSSAHALTDQRRSLLTWGLAMTASGLAFLLYFLRGHINWYLSFVGGNAMVLLVPLLILKAQTALVGARVSTPLLLALSAWSLGGVLWGATFGQNASLGATSMSSGIAAMSLLFAHVMWRHRVARTLPAARFSAVVGLMTALTFAYRAWVAASGQLPPINDSTPNHSFVHIGSLVIGGLFIAATSITFFSMVHELRRRVTQDSARRDGLTGTLTRRAFFEAADALDQAQPARPYAIAMIDLDHFKRVNDTYGHAGGDHLLAHMARLIVSAARVSDLVGRYGGEEFCVLLRDGDAATATAFGERLVEQAQRAEVRLADGRQLQCTLSVGVACRTLPPEIPSAEALSAVINRADLALYRAKALGRNLAVTAS